MNLIKKEDIVSKAIYMHGFGKNKYVPLRAIEQAEVVDAAPVVRGRWIKTVQENGCAEWTDFTCSVCGTIFDGNECHDKLLGFMINNSKNIKAVHEFFYDF